MNIDIKKIRVTDELELTISPAGGISEEKPLLVLTSLSGSSQSVVIHLHEVRHLIDALAEAAAELAGQN